MTLLEVSLNLDEAQELLSTLELARAEGEEYESTNCMIETLENFINE